MEKTTGNDVENKNCKKLKQDWLDCRKKFDNKIYPNVFTAFYQKKNVEKNIVNMFANVPDLLVIKIKDFIVLFSQHIKILELFPELTPEDFVLVNQP